VRIEISETTNAANWIKAHIVIQRCIDRLHAEKQSVDEEYLGNTRPVVPVNSNWFTEYYQKSTVGRERRLLLLVSKLRVALPGWNIYEHQRGMTIQISDEERNPVARIILKSVVLLSGTKTERKVYVDEDNRNKEYIYDSVGNLTRRFAFCVRPADNKIKQGDGRPVRKVEKVENTMFDPSGLSPDKRTHWDRAVKLAKNTSRTDWNKENPIVLWYLAYINYAHNGRLGYCLAASPLRVRDNADRPFADKVGYDFWMIDLAQVPTSMVIVNMHSTRPYHTEGLTRTSGAPADQWIGAGTGKNRELFCSDIPLKAVVKRTKTDSQMITTWNWKQKFGA